MVFQSLKNDKSSATTDDMSFIENKIGVGFQA